jgi:hypothetical protein
MSPEDAILDDLAARQDGIFTLIQARECGLTEWRIHKRIERTWTALYPQVFRMPGAPRTWRGDVRAACYAAEPNAVVSHRTAAWFYDLPGARVDLIELSCPRWRRSQVANITVHESTLVPPCDVQLLHDLPISRPERVVFELASIYRSPDFIERVLHAARRKQLITYASTRATFERLAGRGRPGVTVFRAALERWQPDARPTESEMETTLLHLLRQYGLPEPMLQYEVFDRGGRFVARVDAAFPEHRVLLEYDSRQEHSDEWALARDASRRNRLIALSYRLLIVRHGDITSGGKEIVAAIRSCMRPSLAEPA